MNHFTKVIMCDYDELFNNIENYVDDHADLVICKMDDDLHTMVMIGVDYDEDDNAQYYFAVEDDDVYREIPLAEGGLDWMPDLFRVICKALINGDDVEDAVEAYRDEIRKDIDNYEN